MEMLKKGWKLGFCLISKGSLVVSVEPRACVGPRREQRLVSASLAPPPTPPPSEHSLFHLPYHGGDQVASQKQGPHHTLHRL